VLRALNVLPYDLEAARLYGHLSALLETKGQKLADADLQIAATALVHDLELVTGNVRLFSRVVGLRVNPVLADARA
jgi:predicted nucleic acid-binding protein